MIKKQNIVVFDFDGTLSARDANAQFYKYCLARSWRPWAFLPLTAFAMLAKFVGPRGTDATEYGYMWRQMARRFLTAGMVKKLAPGFIKQHRRERFGWAKDQVAKEKAAGNIVLCISAGTDFLIPGLVSDMGFDAVICSETDPANPWRYEFLCWGDNKVVALSAWSRANKILPRVVRSYSDSRTDLPIMKLAAQQVWIDPKTGLRK